MFEQQLKTIYRGTCGVGVLPLRNSLDTAWPCQGHQTELQDRGCLCVCPPFTKEQHLGVTGTTKPHIHPQKTGLAFKVSLPSRSKSSFKTAAEASSSSCWSNPKHHLELEPRKPVLATPSVGHPHSRDHWCLFGGQNHLLGDSTVQTLIPLKLLPWPPVPLGCRRG